jgi:GNAT superfamily N-acetyltransferase
VSYAIRRAAPDDAALLAEHRARVWREVGGHSEESMAAQIPVWTAWFHDAVEDGTYVAFVADENGEPIASGALLVHVEVPRPGSPSDLGGRVHSVYVVPHARRRGIARALMAEIMDYAQTALLIGLRLHPSEDARPLYASLGFGPRDEMGLLLAGD